MVLTPLRCEYAFSLKTTRMGCLYGCRKSAGQAEDNTPHSTVDSCLRSIFNWRFLYLNCDCERVQTKDDYCYRYDLLLSPSSRSRRERPHIVNLINFPQFAFPMHSAITPHVECNCKCIMSDQRHERKEKAQELWKKNQNTLIHIIFTVNFHFQLLIYFSQGVFHLRTSYVYTKNTTFYKHTRVYLLYLR